MKKTFLITFLLIITTTSFALDNIFFMHHSTGRNLINEGSVRTQLYSMVDCEFWHHDYHSYGSIIGLWGPDGNYTGTSYGEPFNHTDVVDLYAFWTGSSTAKMLTLLNHEIIGFKSCYPNAAITSDSMLNTYKTQYTAIIDELHTHGDKEFYVMGFPPLRESRTTASEAARAREFVVWLEPMCTGNVYFFPFFDLLAGSDNFLKNDYERSVSTDSHPNVYANQQVGPVFAEFLSELVNIDTGIPGQPGQPTWGQVKRLYR